MPKAKSKTKSSGAASVSENTQSQTSSQGNKTSAAMSDEEIETKVNDMVRYMLVMDQKKLPIKRGDFTKNVLKEHSRAFNVIMEKAKEKMNEVVELQSKQVKSYILVNCHEAVADADEDDRCIAGSEESRQLMGLLMVILSTIFMNNNVMADVPLYNMLRTMGVDLERSHPVFGSLANVLKDFERQCYLEKTRIPNSDPPTFEFRWGQRAQQELSKRQCLQFVTKVYEMENAAQWTSQWADMTRDEEDANQQQQS